MSDQPEQDATARSFLKHPGEKRNPDDPVVVGRGRTGVTDIYHRLLNLPAWGLLLVLAGVYLSANVFFAGLYLLDPGGVTNARPCSFIDAFFFSVQTLGTVGYGAMTPKSVYANSVVTVEAFFSVVLVAVTTGVIFAKVSRPTARVMFSRVAVITDHDGAPTLMFRAANRRANQILEAEVMLNLVRQVTTAEGLTLRQLQELPVSRARSPLFALSWLVMHPINESSPLFGATPESLIEEGAELIVVLSGVDETFAQRIHARYAYKAEDIQWRKQFKDILSIRADGRRQIDYNHFHSVRDP